MIPAISSLQLIGTLLLMSLSSPDSSWGKRNQPDSSEKIAPIRLYRGNIIRYTAILAGGGLAFALDRDLRELYQKPRIHGKTGDWIFENAENLGTETPYFFIAPAFIGYGLIAGDKKSVRTGGELAVGLIASYGMTSGVKAVFGRKRPYESDSPYEFFDGGRSFYSGHTITAFTAATIISSNYPKQNLAFVGIDREFPIVPVITYTLAGLVGIQRLYGDVHWSSDVYVGAMAGYALGRLTVLMGNKFAVRFLTEISRDAPTLAVVFEVD